MIPPMLRRSSFRNQATVVPALVFAATGAFAQHPALPQVAPVHFSHLASVKAAFTAATGRTITERTPASLTSMPAHKHPALAPTPHKAPARLSAAMVPMHLDPYRPAATAAPAPSPAAAAASNAFAFTSTAATERTTHLAVGHVMFLNTRARVKRIYIANPAVLDSYTVSPNQIVVTAKAPGLSSVVVWDENDESQTYMVSSDVDVDELRASLQQAFPNEGLDVQGREGKVVLSGSVGTDATSDAAVKLATLYSKDVSNSLLVNPARIKQVRLKVRIVEVDRSKLEQFGINIFNPGGSIIGGGTTGQFASAPTYTPPTPTTPATLALSDPLNFFLYSFKNNIGASIKDLENRQILQILAEPNITTISGQKASFLAGGEFPFPVVSGGNGGLPTVSVQFRPYGVKVEFTPIVNTDGSIALKIMPEVSALDFSNSVTISGYTIPALSTKRADTQVILRSGQSFAISGLLDRRTTDAFSKTPGIASVPILGQLFRSKGINLSTSELVIIVTPTVIDPLTQTDAVNEPDPAVPYMSTERYDKGLPASARKP